jgi:hypothetical protein
MPKRLIGVGLALLFLTAGPVLRATEPHAKTTSVEIDHQDRDRATRGGERSDPPMIDLGTPPDPPLTVVTPPVEAPSPPAPEPPPVTETTTPVVTVPPPPPPARVKVAAPPVAEPAPEPAPVDYSGDPRAIGQQMAAERGWTGSQWQCLESLWTHESGWDAHAGNSSGAYGIPQALPGSKMAANGDDWRDNPVTQISWGLDYIAGRYGTPCNALSHWRSYNWY